MLDQDTINKIVISIITFLLVVILAALIRYGSFVLKSKKNKK